MALPQKHSRIIEVDGKKYRWMIAKKKQTVDLLILELHSSSKLLRISFDPQNSYKPISKKYLEISQTLAITPNTVRQAIQYGLENGWQSDKIIQSFDDFKEVEPKPLELDDLDRRLLDSFAKLFPRPNEIPFFEYDVSYEEMQQLCTGDRPYENVALMNSFASDNRYGFFGDWTHFPHFAGDLAVFARRHSFYHDPDLLFYYLNTSEVGLFDRSLFPLLAEWVADILMPWYRPIARSELFFLTEIHAIGYMGIYCNVGGDPNYIISQNIQQSRISGLPTQLLQIIYNRFLASFEPIYQHFNTEHSSGTESELPLKGGNLVSVIHVQTICMAIDSNRAKILAICEK
jgi:hypothetical protein